MLHKPRHCLLALLMLLQSVSTAWAQLPWQHVQYQQVHVIDAQSAAAEHRQPSKHCMMMAKHAHSASAALAARPASTSASEEMQVSKVKSNCPCCDTSCSPVQCAVMHTPATLPVIHVIMAFATTQISSTRYAQTAGKRYSAPPTPPPNVL